MHKDATFFDTKTSGDIMRLFNNDVNTACGNLLNNMKQGISRIFSSLSLVAVLLYNSWELAIIAIIVLICAVVPLTKMRQMILAITSKSESAVGKIITAYNKLKMDLIYIQNYSLAMDFKLILMTVKILFKKFTSILILFTFTTLIHFL